ncbi:MAG: PSD1 and planctomycete cytochrome C domain-containing protein [Gemmataceae bacterium]|nr:PSD1 and planctomycete cytochrome C domain-containing protein [Gemmataceae bacterium]
MTAVSLARLGAICTLGLGWFFALAPVASAAVTLPGGAVVEKVDFERHIMGLFGRMGCNSGSCHGSFQGKGGFRLSLFGYDPEKDYAALTRDSLGRRINPVDPDRSLLLLKATGQAEHAGGKRFGVDSWQYKLFRAWIVDGYGWSAKSGEVAEVIVSPAEQVFTKPGQTAQLMVKARYGDGSVENITAVCDFRTNNDAIADVTSLGEVKSLRPGDTAIIVAYRGTVLPVRVLVPTVPAEGFKYPDVPQVNYIDREVFAKLQRLNIVPSDLAGDAEFLRRVTLDTIGCLPTPEDVRAFLADQAADKRAKKIDELLAHPMHAALWGTKFSDITGNDTLALEQPAPLRSKRSQMWHDWFRKRVADNMPYDQIVKGVLTATSRGELSPEDWIKQVNELDEAAGKGFTSNYAERSHLDLFWRRQQNVAIEQWGEKTAAAFMGIRLECAQCHKHPLDRWTQADYRAYANIFTQVTVGISPDAKKAIDEENASRRKNPIQVGNQKVPLLIREMFIGPARVSLRHPDTNEPLPAKALGGPEIKVQTGKDARLELYEWMRADDNPFFARSFVNRVWGHYFGMGIVHPVDDFSQANPPSNPKLLDALAKDFVEHKFDIRSIERTILNSRAYQLTATPNETNRLDRNNFSRSFVRPLMAEVVVDTLNSALGVTESFGNDAPAGWRAIEVGSSQIQSPAVAHVLRVFGRPPRTSACDCERAMEPALPQTLYRMTDPSLLAKLKAPTGRLQLLLKSEKSDEQILEDLFLATLTRIPSEREKKVFAEVRAGTKDREKAFTDALWALINTREFILNH